jgi:hypothetical protein
LLQEHDHEPVPGLPEELPQGERILWQGAPDWRTLAVEAFHLRKLVVYFALIGMLRFYFLLQDDLSALETAKGMAPFAVLAISGLFIVVSLAWLSARHTLYTLTNRRVVMRIGIVLTVTFNIPFSRITGAHLREGRDGLGDVALEIEASSRIPFLQLWPHARAWHLQHPQPVLRAIPQAAGTAATLTQAWAGSRGESSMSVATVGGSHSSPVSQARPGALSSGATPAHQG